MQDNGLSCIRRGASPPRRFGFLERANGLQPCRFAAKGARAGSQPGTTGCWECIAQRLRGRRRVGTYVAQRKGLAEPLAPPSAALPNTRDAALNLAAAQSQFEFGSR